MIGAGVAAVPGVVAGAGEFGTAGAGVVAGVAGAVGAVGEVGADGAAGALDGSFPPQTNGSAARAG
jgi:hypothetical protein